MSSPMDNMPGDASTSGKSESDSARLSRFGQWRQNNKLGLLTAKFFDEKVPLKKKVSHRQSQLLFTSFLEILSL